MHICSQSNAYGAWDNAKKSFEKGVMIDGVMQYNFGGPYSSVTGDTVATRLLTITGPSA
jgi:K(+)-stimulated pyrophosphate-energized sodium pump